MNFYNITSTFNGDRSVILAWSEYEAIGYYFSKVNRDLTIDEIEWGIADEDEKIEVSCVGIPENKTIRQIYDEKEYGGTGKTFDFGLLEDKISIPFLVAGGIDESNFHDALSLKNCIGIDVCSSVEEMPGVKNHSKVKNLVEKVRSFNV